MTSQLQWVRRQLIRNGFVTRNQALRNNITRLSARIYDLREQGVEIEAEKVLLRNGKYDYKYKLKKDEQTEC